MDYAKKTVLQNSGVAIDSALARFMDKDDMYLKFIKKFLYEEKNIPGLLESVEHQDAKAAFACAHSIKGVAANLGLDGVNDKLIPIVEILRTDSLDGVEERIPGFLEQLDRVKRAFKQIED